MRLRDKINGFALLSALWLLLGIASVAAALIYLRWQGDRESARAIHDLGARYLAESAFQTVIANRRFERGAARFDAGEAGILLNIGGEAVSVRLIDQSTKTDLNRAPMRAIEKRLSSLPLGDEQRRILAARIAQARAADRHFRSVDELSDRTNSAQLLATGFTAVGGAMDFQPLDALGVNTTVTGPQTVEVVIEADDWYAHTVIDAAGQRMPLQIGGR
ncbi:hypothetical protein [Sphingomicrobium arenosum]|uniref:hypothetical protein n=1 Tax=Sphingomicrobium arenosum TaxID=2233861 RepID=UPI002240F25D|nr:hypothetical protein [Sphingomicrobium arenosum]